jgi:hypothetical protein
MTSQNCILKSTRKLLAKAEDQLGKKEPENNWLVALYFFQAGRTAISELAASLSTPIHFHNGQVFVEFHGSLCEYVGYESHECGILHAGRCLISK